MTAKLDAARAKDLRVIHTGRKALAMAETSYRALLRRVTGKESSAEMDATERRQVIEELRRLGFKKLPPGRARRGKLADREMAMSDQASKIRALWLSLYHLGEIEDPSETALAAFVKRAVKVEALQWLDFVSADRVLRQLRSWCERVGFAMPTAAYVERVMSWRALAKLEPSAGSADGYTAKVMLIGTLWQRLGQAGAFRYGDEARIESWLRNRYAVAAPWFLSWEDADGAIEALGKWLRQVKAKNQATGG